MDSFSPMDYGYASPSSEDPLSLSTLMNLETYPELFSPPSAEKVFPLYSYADAQPENWASFALPSFSPHGKRENLCAQNTNFPLGSSLKNSSLADRNFSDESRDDNSGVPAVPKPIINSVSLSEKMLRALSLFKETSGGGILAQFWMPVRHGGDFVLSTTEQPFLLDQTLAGYREISRTFTFPPKEAPGLLLGLPGRVFMSGMPEWTSNVGYYNRLEYLRMDYALSHEVRGSLAVPIFDSRGGSCCAVLELVTRKEKIDFDMEMDNVCNALQAVELRTAKARACPRVNLSKNKKAAFTEILEVLRASCHAHMLPLALTWTPFDCNSGSMDESVSDEVRDGKSSQNKKNMLGIQESACYVNDERMQGFLHACAEHCLEKGQGTAGKALESNIPFFYPDVKRYNIQDYPLAHHARKFGLLAAVAIRLRSTYTGDDDYILEFFLPTNCRESEEQQLVLNNLSSTMQKISTSLRTVSDDDMTKAEIHKAEGASSQSKDISVKHPQLLFSNNELKTEVLSENQNMESDARGKCVHHKQLKSSLQRHHENKRSSTEKNISLSVLQQYFSGSLKDAAKSIGVCPTTLKRICRQHGISRWPSRKIKKVNRSLKRIQTVIDSVQGVEGALKYDQTTGCLVAAVSASERPATLTSESSGLDAVPAPSDHHTEIKQLIGKSQPDSALLSPPTDRSKECKLPPATTLRGGLSQQNLDHHLFTSGSSISLTGEDETKGKGEADDGLLQQSNLSSSSMTDSSGSASSCPTFDKSSKKMVFASDAGFSSTITVKATYMDDMVRFKFLPFMGCNQLFDEIGRRFKLSIGTFQLKYMDDEAEWVLLVNDSDLQECIDVMRSVGSPSMRIMVRDVPVAIRSSTSSNCLLVDAAR